jgi:hypothetical protein
MTLLQRHKKYDDGNTADVTHAVHAVDVDYFMTSDRGLATMLTRLAELGLHTARIVKVRPDHGDLSDALLSAS